MPRTARHSPAHRFPARRPPARPARARRPRVVALTAAVGLALLGAACSSSDEGAGPSPMPMPTTPTTAERAVDDGNTVEVRMFRFRAETLEVPVGTTVTWENRDEILHTVTGDADATVIDGELDGAGTEYSVTFTEPGTYAYFCAIHPVMVGEIVVAG